MQLFLEGGEMLEFFKFSVISMVFLSAAFSMPKGPRDDSFSIAIEELEAVK